MKGGVDLAKVGRPKADNPRKVRIMVRLTEEEYRRLKERAEDRNLSVTEAVRTGVKAFVDSK